MVGNLIIGGLGKLAIYFLVFALLLADLATPLTSLSLIIPFALVLATPETPTLLANSFEAFIFKFVNEILKIEYQNLIIYQEVFDF